MFWLEVWLCFAGRRSGRQVLVDRQSGPLRDRLAQGGIRSEHAKVAKSMAFRRWDQPGDQVEELQRRQGDGGLSVGAGFG